MAHISNVKFFTVDPYIFRHIGGSNGAKNIWTSKYSGSRSIVAKKKYIH